jgi:hypothetical protein
MLGGRPGRSAAVSQFHTTTQSEYGNARFLRTNVLSARPDLKKYTALRFRQEVKRHADAAGAGEDVVVVFMEAQGLEPPLSLVCSDLHLELEGYPVEQGCGDRDPAAAARELGARQGFRLRPWGVALCRRFRGLGPSSPHSRRFLPMRSCRP